MFIKYIKYIESEWDKNDKYIIKSNVLTYLLATVSRMGTYKLTFFHTTDYILTLYLLNKYFKCQHGCTP